jgi:peptidoglycan/xylan/chitin deacetylase (PgdA/CDA1 family)
MKYFRALLCIIFAVLPLACASRKAVYHESEVTFSQPVQSVLPPPPEERDDSFERALVYVKNDSPLIRKYFQLNPAGEDGKKSDLEINVKGEYQSAEDQFSIVYDLASAVKTGDDRFRIEFSLENSKGVSLRDELFWSLADNKAGLLLSLDDDYWQSWRQYFDMFEHYGARLTFFLQGTPDSVADFCVEALTRNHDIAFHTRSHYDLTKVSREVFDRETIEAAEDFRSAGIPLSAFAWPFGFSEPWMRDALSPVFKLTRGYGANFRLYNTEEIRGGYIVSKAIDNIMYPDDDLFQRNIRLLLFTAKFTGAIAPFTTHDISDGAQWGIKPERLEYVLQTAKELKLEFYTYNDFR